jgi:hypothetical protein
MLCSHGHGVVCHPCADELVSLRAASSHLPWGLTKEEYVRLALACLDQAGMKRADQEALELRLAELGLL